MVKLVWASNVDDWAKPHDDGTNKSPLKSTSDAVLAEAAQVITADPGLRPEVQDRTDDVGAHAHHLRLSKTRVTSAVAWLTRRTVAEVGWPRVGSARRGRSLGVLPSRDAAETAVWRSRSRRACGIDGPVLWKRMYDPLSMRAPWKTKGK